MKYGHRKAYREALMASPSPYYNCEDGTVLVKDEYIAKLDNDDNFALTEIEAALKRASRSMVEFFLPIVDDPESIHR